MADKDEATDGRTSSSHSNLNTNKITQSYDEKQIENSTRKIYFSGNEILRLDTSTQTGLIQGLVANRILAAIVGPPDSGKSQLSRQLALAIIMPP